MLILPFISQVLATLSQYKHSDQLWELGQSTVWHCASYRTQQKLYQLCRKFKYDLFAIENKYTWWRQNEKPLPIAYRWGIALTSLFADKCKLIFFFCKLGTISAANSCPTSPRQGYHEFPYHGHNSNHNYQTVSLSWSMFHSSLIICFSYIKH